MKGLWIRAHAIDSLALCALADALGIEPVRVLGLVAAQDPSVRGWTTTHSELVRPVHPTRARRPDIPRAVRQRVYERDGYRCVLCGRRDRLTLDHIVFYSRGGTDDEGNLRTACHDCNSRRQPPRTKEAPHGV
jgi:DNA-directed RNA polymerase subunit RPC12/RpoP